MSWLDKQQNPELILQAKEVHEALLQALQKLTPRQERIIRRRFGFYEETTQREIADELGISTARVGSIEGTALRRLGHPSQAGGISTAISGSTRWETIDSWHGGNRYTHIYQKGCINSFFDSL